MKHVLHEIEPRQVALDVPSSLSGELAADLPVTTFKATRNVLVSSPNARMFYHFDMPGQTLVQLRGRKRIWTSPPTAPFLRPSDVKNTVLGVATEARRPSSLNRGRPIERPEPAAQAQG